MKKRILVNSEAAYLNTGYATYGKELISGLIEAGHEVAEISCYGSADDPRRSQIPWKNYPIAPCKTDEEKIHKLYGSSPANQFGAWRFERICLDFKPDLCISQKDPWMEAFIKPSPFRPFFKWAWAATCDAEPQSDEWIDQFASTDYYFGLSDWGGGVVNRQGKVNYMGSVTSAASEEMRPVPNKVAHKLSMGINPDNIVVGTVMRNQRRKLFPDLFDMFARLPENFLLYCHTSYPDNGWDLPKLMCKYGIINRVLFTYVCSQCHNMSISVFSDAVKKCKHCKAYSSKPASVTNGVDNNTLAKIYNLFDIYLQYSNSEGIGIPMLEAAACGIPVAGTDYSSMEDIVRKLNGYPIPVVGKVLELETGCYRAVPDNEEAASYIKSFFRRDQSEIEKSKQDTLSGYKNNYSWSNIIKKYLVAVDDCPKANWNLPIRQIQIPDKIPKFSNNYDFVNWSVSNFLPFSNLLNSFEANQLLRDLNFGQYKPNPCGYFYSESSYFDRVNFRPFSHEDVLNMLKTKAEIFNFWEKARVGNITFPKENWLD